ncbi:TAP-like protein-domain-containing protein, partial [Penicillium verhagenii]
CTKQAAYFSSLLWQLPLCSPRGSYGLESDLGSRCYGRAGHIRVTDLRYGGSIILNPGGPGGSGVGHVLRQGNKIQDIVDSDEPPESSTLESENTKFYDIIGFDPRAINNTTPQLTCFETQQDRQLWGLQMEAHGVLGSAPGVFDTLWARSKAFGNSCTQHELGESNETEWIGRFMNTPPVIADMVELIERLGEWRETETRNYLDTVTDKSATTAALIKQNRWKKGEETISYWGFSYGSILGMTFAAMQPGRVHRLVVDGVGDAYDYYAGHWLHNLHNSDATLEKFFEYCHEAGHDACPFDQGDVSQTKARFEQLLTDIQSNPIPVIKSKNRGPEIITYSDVMSLTLEALFSPIEIFPTLAQLLSDISFGNGTSFADFKDETRKTDDSSPVLEAGRGIGCLDGADIRNFTKEDYRQYWKKLQGQSNLFGNIWASIRLPCIGWNVQPAWPFNGELNGQNRHTYPWAITNSHKTKAHLFTIHPTLYSSLGTHLIQ